MTRIVGPPGSRRRRRFLVGPALFATIVTMVVGLVVIGGALAAPDDNGLFELDANILDQPAAGDDWSNIFAGTDSAFTDTGIVADPAPQTVFTGGGSKDHEDVTEWSHKSGSVPDKDDITNAYAAAYTQGGDTYAYFGLDRFDTSGSSNVGFWFFQGDVAPVADGSFSGQHEVGDLLVLSEFDEGGTGVTIKVFRWVGPNAGDEGPNDTLQTLQAGAAADCDTTGPAVNVCANVNTANILNDAIPWPYTGKGGQGFTVNDMETGAFFEGGINLDAFFGEAPCVTNFVAETRSSFEVNAVLKDLVHANFALCDADISIAPDDVNDVGDEHTFTVDVSTTVAGNPNPAPDGTIVDVTLTDANGNPITPTTNTCASPGTVGGSCSVTFSSDVAGTITGHAEADVVVGGETIHVETGGTGNNPDAFKVFVNGRVSISPDDVNGIGEPHTFTVTAEQDVGDDAGFVPATNGNVDVTLTDANGAVSEIDAAASTCDDAQPDGDNLDANGQCTITFTSDTAGTVTGHATVSMNLTTSEGTITIVRETDGAAGNSGDAVKEFVDGTLRWLKHDQDGNLLGGATFEVCRTHAFDSGNNTFPDITDECVTVLDNGPADADTDAGEFQRNDQFLGRYTITETQPPPGYAPDPNPTRTVELTVANPSNVSSPPIFVNSQLFKVIVVTCNDSVDPEVLVDSTVTINGEQKETITGVPTHLATKMVTQADLCAIGGASYGNLPANPNLDADIELPDVAPLFPTP
jgi:hypothetical protein